MKPDPKMLQMRVPLVGQKAADPKGPVIDDSRDGGSTTFLQVPLSSGGAEIHKGETLFDRYALAFAPTVLAVAITKAAGKPDPVAVAAQVCDLAQAVIEERRRRLYGPGQAQ